MPINSVSAYMLERMMRLFLVFASVAILGVRIQFKPNMISAVTDSAHAKCNGEASTKTPPMYAPIRQPASPLHPNQIGKTPRRMIGRYRRVKFGIAIE